jgi:glutamate synthase domain-containing protein 2
VGFKLCIGHRREFMCIVKAMLETGVVPDFIVVDGKEGGTGAAPLEFANHVGMPLVEGLSFVHNTLRGAGLRDQVRIGAAGKLVTAFDIARTLAIGADWANSARGFMFAIGCIQAQACHTNRCPTGVATQDKLRQRALDVPDKAQRVANFHRNTLRALATWRGRRGSTIRACSCRTISCSATQRRDADGRAGLALPARGLPPCRRDGPSRLSRPLARARPDSFAPPARHLTESSRLAS